MGPKPRRADGLKVGWPIPVELTALIRRGPDPRLKTVIRRVTLPLERKFGLTSLARLYATNVLKLPTLIIGASRLAGARFGTMVSQGPTGSIGTC